jgi:hypothetical protein
MTIKNRRRASLDNDISLLSDAVKFTFLNELPNGSLGRADVLSGINDMWVSARLASRLLNTDYMLEVQAKGAANGL